MSERGKYFGKELKFEQCGVAVMVNRGIGHRYDETFPSTYYCLLKKGHEERYHVIGIEGIEEDLHGESDVEAGGGGGDR